MGLDPSNIRAALAEAGSAWPIDLMSRPDAMTLYGRITETLAAPGPRRHVAIGPKAHLVNEAVWSLVCGDAAVSLIANVLKVQDVAVWSSGIFFGSPESPIHTDWHQDGLNYSLIDDDVRMFRLWIALTDCGPDVGTMQVAVGGHRSGFLVPRMGTAGDPSGGIKLAIKDDTFPVREVELQAGQAELHTMTSIHRSYVPMNPGYRLNVVADYIDASVLPAYAGDSVTVVKGRSGNFAFEDDPIPDFSELSGAQAIACIAECERRNRLTRSRIRGDYSAGRMRDADPER
jgi:hypothetical protein